MVPSERGVHQGAPLSMCLYQIYINDLLKQLKNCGHGLCIGDINVASPAYADDVSVGSIHKPGLNIMLQIAHDYAKKWRYEYSEEKCVYMMWGRDSFPNLSVTLGDVQLNCVKQSTHMGLEICANSQSENDALMKRIGKCRQSLLAFRGIGTYNVPATPSVLSNAYNSVSLVRMLYGLEVLPVKSAALNELEHAHLQHAKIIQNLPKSTARPAPLATVGWQSIKAVVTKMKMLFIIRMLMFPSDNIYRKVVIFCIRFHDLVSRESIKDMFTMSPTADMYRYARKYGLSYIVDNLISGNDEVNKQAIKIII